MAAASIGQYSLSPSGENSISLRNCWKLELKAPNRQSQYSNVWLWVDKEGGALMKLEGYDWNGKLAKRFTVVSGQKIEDRWFLKQMRIEEFDPGTGKATVLDQLHDDAWIRELSMGSGVAGGGIAWLPDSRRFAFLSEKTALV